MREWARRALDDSEGARVYVQADGPPVTLGAAAARRLLGSTTGDAESARTLAELVRDRGLASVKFADTFGFSRPVYYPFLVHLHLLTPGDAGDELAEAVRAAEFSPSDPDGPDPAMRLWWALCQFEAGARVGDSPAMQRAVEVVDRLASTPGERGTLHRRQGLDDLLDAWTFRELAGLHALGWMAIRHRHEVWWRRVHEITAAHQDVTQPDYTTYQPWGVYTFLLQTETIPFGEQQLHDAVTNLHVEQGGAGLVPGLLLADAAAALDAAADAGPVLSQP